MVEVLIAEPGDLSGAHIDVADSFGADRIWTSFRSAIGLHVVKGGHVVLTVD